MQGHNQNHKQFVEVLEVNQLTMRDMTKCHIPHFTFVLVKVPKFTLAVTNLRVVLGIGCENTEELGLAFDGFRTLSHE